MTKNIFPSMQTTQEEILQEFNSLEGDREAMLHYLIEIGEKLPKLADAHKIDQNKIKGCMSTVWLTYKQQGNQLFLEADSNTSITKGLVGLLLRVLSGQTLENILKTDLFFIDKLGINQIVGSQRTNGFFSMLQQIKTIAAVCQAEK